MDQLLAHLVGDYLLQNGWMSARKSKNGWVALLHGLLYTLPFLLITQKPATLAVIAFSHFIIDYFRVGHRIMWIQERAAPKAYRKSRSWTEFSAAFPEHPEWINFWLRVLIDNTIHLGINYVAIRVMG